MTRCSRNHRLQLTNLSPTVHCRRCIALAIPSTLPRCSSRLLRRRIPLRSATFAPLCRTRACLWRRSSPFQVSVGPPTRSTSALAMMPAVSSCPSRAPSPLAVSLSPPRRMTLLQELVCNSSKITFLLVWLTVFCSDHCCFLSLLLLFASFPGRTGHLKPCGSTVSKLLRLR